jgi:hypothetical protein
MSATLTAITVTCCNCGEETDRPLKVVVDHGRPAEKPMCLSCVLGWPVSMEFLGATEDGVLILKHHSVIGEWTPET